MSVPSDNPALLAEAEDPRLGSAELCLKLLELLADSPAPRGVTEIARLLGTSKARAYRNLRILVAHGYARQDTASERYEIGAKLFVLGESVRERFGVLAAARPEMNALRDETGHAVTLSTLVDGQVTVLELLQGKTFLEFGTRPGTRFDLHAASHGKVALAFGPEELRRAVASGPLRAWTPQTITDRARLDQAIAAVRAQGWASAEGEILVGINALAAPIFDHRGAYQGAIAIVGSSQYIPAHPAPRQIALVCAAARRISQHLGWSAAEAAAPQRSLAR